MNSAEARIRACWDRKASIEELVAWLDDDRAWQFGGYVSFDGDSTTTIVYVAAAALRALAEMAPTAAPVVAVVPAILRLHGRVREISRCTWAPPHEVHLRWTASDLAPFGEALIVALRGAADSGEPDVQLRAREVLADVGAG